jgi:hypothetical protein
MRHAVVMPYPTTDRRALLTVAAAADVDPRTLRRYLRGGRVHPALERAIRYALAQVPEGSELGVPDVAALSVAPRIRT